MVRKSRLVSKVKNIVEDVLVKGKPLLPHVKQDPMGPPTVLQQPKPREIADINILEDKPKRQIPWSFFLDIALSNVPKRKPTPTVPKEEPKDDTKPRPFPPIEIPDDLTEIPFPFPEVPPPSNVPTEPDEWTEDETIPDPRDKTALDPQIPVGPPECSDDPLQQDLLGLPPCHPHGKGIQIQASLRKSHASRKTYSKSSNRPNAGQENHTGRHSYSRHFRSKLRYRHKRPTSSLYRGTSRRRRINRRYYRWY